MSDEIVGALLQNLLARLQRDGASGHWGLSGLVTDGERNALATAIAKFGGQVVPVFEGSPSRFQPVPKARAAELRLDALKRSEPENGELLLCLDFGTAISKAMATSERDSNLVELALGSNVKDPDQIYGLRSSLFITGAGRIHFGPEAVAESDKTEEGVTRKRLDSIKQRLSQGRPGDLAAAMLDEASNPTNVPLSWADTITLYLGYLTDIATSELAGKKGARYVRRRFARPCWEHGRDAWGAGELRLMLAKAQIVADTFHGRWQGGIPADEVKATLQVIDELDQLPEYLLAEGVQEPIAAAASRVETEEKHRGLFVVVDVGAGTSDFAAFWTDQNPDTGSYRAWLIPGTVEALTQAGDSVDGYLQNLLLERAHLRPGHGDYDYAAARLTSDIRRHKEILMRDGAVVVTMPNSSKVKISRDEFFATQAMKDFEQLLRDTLQGVLARADASWLRGLAKFETVGRNQISVVLTGGGAALQVVQNIAKGRISVHGLDFPVVGATAVPAWIDDDYPALTRTYAQLAVAIGGAARQLPELGPAVSHFGGDVEAGERRLPPQYKK